MSFDIVPFALPNTPRNEVRVEEVRDIQRIVVRFRKTAHRPAVCFASAMHQSFPCARARSTGSRIHEWIRSAVTSI